MNQPLPAFLHGGGLNDRRELSLYSDASGLRKPECCEGKSGIVGENSRASKSCIEALMLGCESRYACRDVMLAGSKTIHAAVIISSLCSEL